MGSQGRNVSHLMGHGCSARHLLFGGKGRTSSGSQRIAGNRSSRSSSSTLASIFIGSLVLGRIEHVSDLVGRLHLLVAKNDPILLEGIRILLLSIVLGLGR